MKKILVIGFICCATLVSAQTKITKNLGDFNILKVYNGVDVELIQSTEQRIEITGKKAEKVVVKLTNNTLRISLKFPVITANNQVKVRLFFSKNLHTIDANEGASIQSKKIEQLQLEVSAQEKSYINLGVITKHLYIKSISGGVVQLTGTTKNQYVSVELGGVYHGYGVQPTDTSIVKAGTGAKAEILTGETLDAKVTFGGAIYYKGTPELFKEKKIIGGVIEQRN